MFKKDNEEIDREIYRDLATFALKLIEERLAENLSVEEIKDMLNKCKNMLKKEVSKIDACLDLVKSEEIDKFCRDMNLGYDTIYLKDLLESYARSCRDKDKIVRGFLDEVKQAVINVRKNKNLLVDRARILCILFNRVIGCHTDLRRRPDLSGCIRCDSFSSSMPTGIFNSIYKRIENILSGFISKSELETIRKCLEEGILNVLRNCSIPDLSINCEKYDISVHPCVLVCERYVSVSPSVDISYIKNNESIIVKFYDYIVMEIRRVRSDANG